MYIIARRTRYLWAALLAFGGLLLPVTTWSQASGQLFCPAGPYGPGGYYWPYGTQASVTYRCVQGALLQKSQDYCPPGKLGNGGHYWLDDKKCVDGATRQKPEEYCPPGEFGAGGFYWAPDEKCLSGRRLNKNDQYCPPGKIDTGGIYRLDQKQCFEGAVVPIGYLYCPGPGNTRGHFYEPTSRVGCEAHAKISGALAHVVSGDVFVISRKGERRRLQAGESFKAGDTISTGSTGYVSAALRDGGGMQIIGSSILSVQEAPNDGVCSPTGSACRYTMELMAGGIRWITGHLTNKSNIRILSPLASFGIRGTDFEVLHLENPHSEGFPEGGYIRVRSGIVEISMNESRYLIEAGTVAYMQDQNQPPRRVEDADVLFSDFR